MKTLITGGRGLIGSALTNLLLQDADRIFVLTRNTSSIESKPEKITYIPWDAMTDRGWGHLLEEVDAVIHLSGENLSAGRWTPKQKAKLLESRVKSGQAVVEAFHKVKRKPSVLIQASGAGYYGVSNPELLDENAPNGKNFLSSLAREWEESTKAVESLGVRRVIIRSGVVFSPDGGALKRMVLPFKAFLGGRLGSGDQWLSWIHIEDEVRAIRFLLNHEMASGPYNLSAVLVTNSEFAQIVGKVLGRPAILPVPSLALRFLLGEMSTVVLDGQRLSSRRLSNLGFTFKYPLLEDALNNILISQS
ncbi:MAG: TIGR01777 family oxidoreductase [Anaerolineaceae bacterium]